MAATRQVNSATLPAAMQALAGVWSLAQGEHPSLARFLPMLAQLPLFPTAPQARALLAAGLPVQLATHGHHVVTDAAYQALVLPPQGLRPAQDEIPLSPLFVRDLTGRVIHTGLNPLPAGPGVPLFPVGCADVPASMPGAEHLENAAFFTLRRLEVAPARPVPWAANENLHLRAAYAQPAAYPYKLRLDTFYADGWRLPQVPRVFARPASAAQAQAAAQQLQARWEQRPAQQSYEDFYDTNNGATWFEELFMQGCTVIPTLEAYNGKLIVDDAYQLVGAEPGRAVPGLHTVVRQQPSASPVNTILEVLAPGWVTASGIQPAQVVVSDGSQAPASTAPVPLLPNLALPHPRVSPVWGAVWLPTHPQHFTEPALWDWSPTGHFQQISGPLWDPLHYVYSSTMPLLRSLRKPLPEVPWLYQLAPELKARFHPVIAQTWYDTLNERTAQQRAEDLEHPLCGSLLDALPLLQTVAPIGYHPFPAGLEIELEPSWFPIHHPVHTPPCPAALKNRLAPVATPTQTPAQLQTHHVVVSEPLRQVLNQAAQSEATPSVPTGFIWLPAMAASQLLINVKRLFAARTYRQQLAQLAEMLRLPDLPGAIFQWREATLAWRRLRYRLLSKYPAVWQQAVQQGFNLSAAEALITVPPGGLTPPAPTPLSPLTQLGLVAAPPPSPAPAPAMQAARLRSPAGAGKLSPKAPRKKTPVTPKQASNHG